MKKHSKKDEAIQDGWKVGPYLDGFKAEDSWGNAIVRKGYESPRVYVTEKQAWMGIVAHINAKKRRAARNWWDPNSGRPPYLGD